MSSWRRRDLLAAAPAVLLAGCGRAAAPRQPGWEQVTAAASFPGAYGFPVHVAPDGRFVALHPRGTWSSRDGVAWGREPLPPAPAAHAYVPQVQHDGASWSLSGMTGNYLGFALDRVVRRTRDYRAWETVGHSATLPPLVFATIASFRGAMWLLGGFDGHRATQAIWRSVDGLDWHRVVEHAPWSPRSGAKWAVFRDRLWLIGGGEIDGPVNSDVWSSADGLSWRREAARLATPEPTGFTSQVYADRLWLLGANRSGGFGSGMLVSADGRDWQPLEAPWSARGVPATWVAGGRLFLTGGKYSHPGAGGEPVFVYSNDVWAMTA